MYNEESGAERALRAVAAALDDVDRPCALIVVDDGSRDRTREVLARVAPALPAVSIVHHDGNQGYGAALQTGGRAAGARGFEYVLYMDSDLTNDPRDIPRFVERMDEGADVIKATRYSGGGGMRGVPFRRAVISRTGALVARLLFRVPLHDCTNGFRAVRVPILQQMHLRETRFPVIVEELYWCSFLARRYAEVPVVLASRAGEQRRTSFSYTPSVFWRYLKYCLLAFFRVRPAGLARPIHS
jgi:dolichol-phosphate mannosyltransferase